MRERERERERESLFLKCILIHRTTAFKKEIPNHMVFVMLDLEWLKATGPTKTQYKITFNLTFKCDLVPWIQFSFFLFQLCCFPFIWPNFYPDFLFFQICIEALCIEEKNRKKIRKPSENEFINLTRMYTLLFCRKHKRRKQNVPIPRKSCPFPQSDYARTFQAVQHPRPRSSKRPPPSPTVRDRHSAPMIFSTNQRDDFRSLGVVPRTKPIIPVSDEYTNFNFMYILSQCILSFFWTWHFN